MMRQDQHSEGGEAYQAGGNLTVVHGMDADQMAAVMVAMAKHLQVHFAEAEAKLDERLSDFRESVLREFSKPENEGCNKAFSEPDFQFALNDAQKVFARDGSSQLRDDLVNLLIQRSKHDSQDRVAKILNNAIELAGSFSKHEYAAMVMIFLFTNVKLQSKVRHLLINQFSTYLSSFVDDLSDNPTVYEYIESQRCGSINYLVTRDLSELLREQYALVLRQGFSQKQLDDIYPNGGTSIFQGLISGSDNYANPYCFNVVAQTDLTNELRKRGMPEDAVSRAAMLHSSCIPNSHKIMQIFKDEVVGFSKLIEIWDKTALSKMALTAIGKTIAHSSLSSRVPFNAPLSIWVQ